MCAFWSFCRNFSVLILTLRPPYCFAECTCRALNAFICLLLLFSFVLFFFLGYVFGGDVLRLFHGHMDECLALPEAGSENEFK